jgi:hypothetical protein
LALLLDSCCEGDAAAEDNMLVLETGPVEM